MLRKLVCLLGVLAFNCSLAATDVIVLGTGTPTPDPGRAGAGIVVVVNGEAYLFDAGSGVHFRAVEAMGKYNLPELTPQNINYIFVTHLHSDHIHDLDNFAMARWWGRPEKLNIYGPEGLDGYIDNISAMGEIEGRIRAAGTPPELITDRKGFRPVSHEIQPGVVFENADIRVEAFTVPHGDIKPAFGYKVTTADKTIVISGDTTYSEEVARQAQGADLLFHEVISGDLLSTMSEFWQQYHGTSHTVTQDVAKIANAAKPGTVVLYHILFIGQSPEGLVAEITRDYNGKVVLANDLDRF
jgi:ribonuclease Z